MKRIITSILAVVALVTLSAPPASAAYATVRGCSESQYYFPATGNGLIWSYSDQEAFHTPTQRTGFCGHVYVVSLGVNNAPPCFMAMVRTYNEDRSVRVNGPWYRFEGIGRLGDLRNGIDDMRLYRVYVYGCDYFRDPRYTPGLTIYTHLG